MPASVTVWLEEQKPMPLAVQWRLAVVAKLLFPPGSDGARLTRALRGQLEARAAFLQRGYVTKPKLGRI